MVGTLRFAHPTLLFVHKVGWAKRSVPTIPSGEKSLLCEWVNAAFCLAIFLHLLNAAPPLFLLRLENFSWFQI